MHAQKRWQASQGAETCPAAGRSTRHGGRWCDRCRDPAGGAARHRCGGQRIAVPLAHQVQCGTVAITEQVITCAESDTEQVTVALAVPEQVALPQPVALQVAVAVSEQVALPQPFTLAEQVTVPESVALARSRSRAEQLTLPEPVAVARQVQVTVALSVAP